LKIKSSSLMFYVSYERTKYNIKFRRRGHRAPIREDFGLMSNRFKIRKGFTLLFGYQKIGNEILISIPLPIASSLSYPHQGRVNSRNAVMKLMWYALEIDRLNSLPLGS